jgi:hypothetical protein
MSTQEIIFIAAIAATVLITFAWTFAPRTSRLLRFWIPGEGRGAALRHTLNTTSKSADIDRSDSRLGQSGP